MERRIVWMCAALALGALASGCASASEENTKGPTLDPGVIEANEDEPTIARSDARTDAVVNDREESSSATDKAGGKLHPCNGHEAWVAQTHCNLHHGSEYASCSIIGCMASSTMVYYTYE
mgnify:CR=1 FL=1